MSHNIRKEPYSRESVLDFLQKEASELNERTLAYRKSDRQLRFGLGSSKDAAVLEDEYVGVFNFVVSGDLLRSRELEEWTRYFGGLDKKVREIEAWEKANMYWPTAEEFKELKSRKH